MRKQLWAACLGVLLVSASAVGSAKSMRDAKWIWFPEKGGTKSVPSGSRFFRRDVEVPAGAKVKSAHITLSIDNSGHVFVNGKAAGRKRSGWNALEVMDLTKHFVAGRNVIAIDAKNAGAGPAGLLCRLEVKLDKGKPIVVMTDDKWTAHKTGGDGWHAPDADTSEWAKVAVIGKFGISPWTGMGGASRSSGGVPGSEGFFPKVDVNRPLGREDARKLLEADWLFQADGNPDAERTRKEIGWARELAERISSLEGIREVSGDIDPPDFTNELAELTRVEEALGRTEDEEDLKQLYFDVRAAKRRIAFRNPLIDFNEILMVDGPYPKVGHGHSNHESGHRNGSW